VGQCSGGVEVGLGVGVGEVMGVTIQSCTVVQYIQFCTARLVLRQQYVRLLVVLQFCLFYCT
jgi:hypothetical protein